MAASTARKGRRAAGVAAVLAVALVAAIAAATQGTTRGATVAATVDANVAARDSAAAEVTATPAEEDPSMDDAGDRATASPSSAVPAASEDSAVPDAAPEEAGSFQELYAIEPLDASLTRRIAEESRTGACAGAYAQLRAALVRFVDAEHARVAGLQVPGKPARFASRRVDLAALHVAYQLPEHPCRATKTGAWALLYDRIDGVLAEEMTRAAIAEQAKTPGSEYLDYVDLRVNATGRLAFTPAAGARVDVPFSLGGAPLLALDTTDEGMDTSARTVDDLEAGDVDGDGVPEVLVLGRQGTFSNIEGADVRTHLSALYRASASGVARVAGVPPGLVLAHLVDGDGDGLADLTSASPYFGAEEGVLGDVEVNGPELLVHTLRGGGFSRDDAAARAYATKLCPARPTSLGYGEGDPDAPGPQTPLMVSGASARVIDSTVCAILWNVPGATLRGWLAKANSGQELVRWTTVTPPLRLDAASAGDAGGGM